MRRDAMPKNTINKTNSEELLPKEGSDELGPRIFEILNEILNYRETLKKPEDWTRYYELRRNKHWKTKTKGSVKLVSANMIGSHHQRTVNMLTDNNPTFNAVQAGEMGEDAEEKLALLTNVIDDFWLNREQQHVLEESVSTGEMYGTVGEFGSFNGDINYPEGEVEFESMDPFYYGLYPVRIREVEKAEGFLRWYPKTVREAKRIWPEQSGKITGDLALLEDIQDERQESQDAGRRSITRTVINSLTRFLSGSKPSRDDSDELFIVEAWVKDYTQENGKSKYKGNIRRVRVCNGGAVVLDDHDNPSINPDLDEKAQAKNYLFNRFPLSHNQSVTDTSSPFGMSDFEQLETLNIEVNKAISQLTMYKDKAARLKLLNPKDSGVSNEELDNAPGIINPTNHIVAQSIGYVQPPTLPVDIVSSLSVYKDFFNEVAGTFTDVLQGQRGGSEVIAYKAIAALLEEASRMLKGKIRNYSKMIRERGRMYLALAQNWYTDDRFISFSSNGKTENKAINKDVLQIPGKINVVNGSTMPVSLIQKREEAVVLFKMGAIDQEELLKAVDWDNWREVINRMQQGPLGEFLEKLALVGVPEELLIVFKQVASMDDKEIEKAVKDGKIPPFIEVLQAILQQQPETPPDPEMLKAQNEAIETQAKVAETEAKIREIDSKVALNVEKAMTERVEQQVAAKGVEFDEEKLKMQRAELIDQIKTNEHLRRIGKVDSIMKTGKDALDLTSSAKSSKEGPYKESGLKSNNKEI
jgi:hypothetical protein